MRDTVDGELVNVEDGRALAPVMRDVLQRFGPMAADAQQQVEQVTWASATEASVVFSLWVNGAQYLPGQRGTAKVIDGRWKIARSTFVGLMASIGVTVPGG